MSLYNMIHGVNPTAPQLLFVAGFYPSIAQHPGLRFRDCYANEDGTEVIVYTRIGGANRSQYAHTIELLRGRPNYLRDEDDSFDSTFASFHFAPLVPEAAEVLRKLHEAGESGSERPAEARKLMDDVVNKRDTPAVRDMIEKTRPIAEGLAKALEGDVSSVDISNLQGYGVQIFKAGETPIREETPRASDENA